MRRDAQGFFYFVDRVGDTFRWKGENVATSEVAEVLMACPASSEATVYGVAVPGPDGPRRHGGARGRGGLRSSRAARGTSPRACPPMRAARSSCASSDAIAVTETFKQRKAPLVGEGFDPARRSADPLFVDDREAGGYVPLDPAVHARILAGGTPALRPAPASPARLHAAADLGDDDAGRRDEAGEAVEMVDHARVAGVARPATPAAASRAANRRALVAQRIELRRMDQGRRQPGKVAARSGESRGSSERPARRIVGEVAGHHGGIEQVAFREGALRGALLGEVEHRAEQELQRRRRRAARPRSAWAGDGGQRAAGRIAADRDAAGIDARSGRPSASTAAAAASASSIAAGNGCSGAEPVVDRNEAATGRWPGCGTGRRSVSRLPATRPPPWK